MSRPPHSGAARVRPTDEQQSAEDATAPPGRSAPASSDDIVWLKSALRRRFGPDLADDIAHETYLKLAHRPAPHAVANPRGLLMTVAFNLMRDTFRRNRVRADHAAHSAPASPRDELSGRSPEDDLAVREAILALPPQLRDVLLLSKIGGLTSREIAQRYGLSRSGGQSVARGP